MITGARVPVPLDLTGLRVAITAGAGGIGRVMADSFAACGASLFVSDVDTAALAACGHPGMSRTPGGSRTWKPSWTPSCPPWAAWTCW